MPRRKLKRLLMASWRLLPWALRRFLVRQILEAEQEGEPAAALRRLFTLEDSLTQSIVNASTELGAGVHPKHRLMQYHRYFIDRVRPDTSLLDVGCGRGTVSHEIVQALAHVRVTGIDASEESIAFARTRFQHARLRFRVGVAPLDLPVEPFDAVILSNVLEHVEDRQDFLAGLCRCCTPRHLVIRLPLFDRDWTIPLRKELDLSYFSDATHFAELTAEGWIEELTSNGLEVIHQEIRWGEIWLDAVPRREEPAGLPRSRPGP